MFASLAQIFGRPSLKCGCEGLDREEHRPTAGRKENKAVLQVEGDGLVIDRVNHESANAGGLRDLESSPHRFREHRRADAVLLVALVCAASSEQQTRVESRCALAEQPRSAKGPSIYFA